MAESHTGAAGDLRPAAEVPDTEVPDTEVPVGAVALRLRGVSKTFPASAR